MAPDITLRNIENVPAPVGHYSHTTTAGGLVFISGQLPVAVDGSPRCDAPFEEQARLVLQNIESCLGCAGVTKQHLVSVRVYITDINLWPLFNKIYAEWIGEHRPSRAVAGVSQLHYGAALEVEAVALSE
ncbi:RidA family protein [Cedecea sp. P7760]|jgi:2-iminobutanoate/2-iminopropanoate deaminase|uniref:RidA family protein n=1 Tax=Cedecea TaxID=158483 RepID=UPI00159F9DCE|nr:RidA family protein [Cedecea sp. P7760]NWC64550.1 RidA family protein [Cedecea sp. P7760]